AWGALGRSHNARFGDVFVLYTGRELCANSLVADTEGTADTTANQAIEAVDAPPQPPAKITHPFAATALTHVRTQPRLVFTLVRPPINVLGNFDGRSIFIMEAKIDRQPHGNTDDVPKAWGHGPKKGETGQE